MIRVVYLPGILACALTGAFFPQPVRKSDQLKYSSFLKERVDHLGDHLPPDVVKRFGTHRFRGSKGVLSVAISPDGRSMLTGEYSGPVWLSDAKTGERKHELATRTLYPFGVAFSPDGKRMAGGLDLERRIYVWDSETRLQQLLKSRYLNDAVLYSLSFSPDGKHLATGAEASYPLELWDVEKGEVIETFDGYSDETVFGVAFSPDGKLLASGGGRNFIKGRVCIWDVATRKQVTELKGLRDCVRSIAFSPDGKLLAAACLDKRLILWDVATWKMVEVIEADSSTTAVAFSKDGKWLAFTSFHQVYLCDPTKGKVLRRIGCSCGSMNTLVFTPDNKTLFSAGSDNAIRRWDVKTGEAIFAAPGHETTVQTVRFSPDGSTLASQGSNNQLHLWDVATGKELHRLTLSVGRGTGSDEDRVHDYPVVFTPDGKTVFVRTYNPNEPIQGWDVTTGQKRFHLFDKDHNLFFFDLSPDGGTVAAPTSDYIHLWSVEARKEIPEIGGAPPGQSESPTVGNPLLFLTDGRVLVSNRMTDIRLVDCATGAVLAELELPKPKPSGKSVNPTMLRRIVLSPDRHLLAGIEMAWSRDQGNAVFVWEITTGKMLGRFAVAAPKGKGTAEQHDGAVCTVGFSPDGRLLATTGLFDKTLRLWDVRTGKHLHCFKGHDGGVTSVDFHPDGKTLASGSTDTTILLWDVSKYYPSAGDAPAPEKFPALWDDLASTEPHPAFKAADSLVAARDKTVALLAARLQPIAKPDAKTIQRLLDDLEARDFKVREKATQKLTRLGSIVEVELRRKLKDKPSLDLERRLQALLQEMRPWIRDPDTLRGVRAVAVLERIGTADAAALLKKLAFGAEEATLSREARAAGDRLRHRR